MANNDIEKNAETIKNWLKHINFDAEHPGYANDIYDKLDQIVKESNKFNETKSLVKEVRISDEQIMNIIDTVTEYMYCNYGDCCMKEEMTWDKLQNVRNEIKENAMEMIKGNLNIE